MTTLFDNIDQNLGDRLVATFRDSNRLDAAVGYFNLRGWNDLAAALDEREAESDPAVRVLIGMTLADQHDRVISHLQHSVDGSDDEPEIDGTEAARRRDLAVRRFREQLMRGLPTEQDRQSLRRMKRHMESGLLQVKLFTRRPMHGKTYICHRDDINVPIVGFVGSSNLTVAGLKHQYELNVDVVDGDAGAKLSKWFEDRWGDNFTIDITPDLIQLIDQSWVSEVPFDPYLVYLKVCFLLSQDARRGLVEYGLPASMEEKLLEYQASAVKTLARRIVHRGGAMLGDVVGLGKTITAVAVALVLREDLGDTLILCPKNLERMWLQYLDEYEVSGRVIPFSRAVNELPDLRRYRLVIIDESHTLRSDTRQDYGSIRQYLRENDSKVLLLTATPYNKRYGDVGNQLSLFLDADENLGITPVAAIKADPRIVDKVDGKVATLEAFKLSEEAEDWRRLMSEHLVRRTRSFIKSNFAEIDPETGREFLTFSDGNRFYFPEREPRPLPHSYGDTDPARLMVEESTLDAINNLKLPRYALAGYQRQDATPSVDEVATLKGLQTSGGHLTGFTRTGLYKRLSSSGHAFVLSLQRHLARNQMFIFAIDNGMPLPIGSVLESQLEPDSDDPDRDLIDEEGESGSAKYEALRRRDPRSVKWVSSGLFTDTLRDDLATDSQVITDLLSRFGEVTHQSDSKIDALEELLSVTHPDEKVLIFSEYRDTVDYVTEALRDRGIESVVGVSGDSSDPTEIAVRFSPRSNRLLLGQMAVDDVDEIRVLVSTDVLSEGQNLQDSHIVINYDLPWAIIKLIQRAGRTDRVGQEADTVYVYSFLEDDSVNAVLQLRQRIRRRLKESAQVFGSDEQFFGTADEIAKLEDFYNGNMPDIEDDEAEVDAASIAYEAWSRAEKEFPKLAALAQELPDLVATAKASVSEPGRDALSGVVTYVRTERDFDGFGLADDAGNLRLLTATEALRILKCSPQTPAVAMASDHFDQVARLVRGPLERPRLTAGQLRGTRLQVWRKLNGSLVAADPDVERALDLIFELPLTAEADRRLRSVVRGGSIEDIASRLLQLASENGLVVANDHQNDPLRVVSSMGIVIP